MTRFNRTAVFFTLAATAIAGPISAQTDSILPRRGTWGADAAAFTHAGSLLRFSSPRSAWLFGHFSVGAVSLLQAERTHTRATNVVSASDVDVENTSTENSWSVSGNLFRVLGAVYF